MGYFMIIWSRISSLFHVISSFDLQVNQRIWCPKRISQSSNSTTAFCCGNCLATLGCSWFSSGSCWGGILILDVIIIIVGNCISFYSTNLLIQTWLSIDSWPFIQYVLGSVLFCWIRKDSSNLSTVKIMSWYRSIPACFIHKDWLRRWISGFCFVFTQQLPVTISIADFHP